MDSGKTWREAQLPTIESDRVCICFDIYHTPKDRISTFHLDWSPNILLNICFVERNWLMTALTVCSSGDALHEMPKPNFWEK